MLKHFKQTTTRTSRTKRTLDIKTNFGPLKHERTSLQSKYLLFCFYKFKIIITWLFTNAQFFMYKIS